MGALARHYDVAPVSRHVQQHGLGKIAVRVENREALAGSEVLQQRRSAGAGLADDIQVSAPRVGDQASRTPLD
jgi:hypothetical protein